MRALDDGGPPEAGDEPAERAVAGSEPGTEPDAGTEPASALFAWPELTTDAAEAIAGRTEPRPVLVSAASAFLLLIGALELVLATIVLVAFGMAAIAYGALVGLLAAGAVVLGIRIRDGRNRTGALTIALVTMLLAPLTLGASVLGLCVGTSATIVVIALVRHRAWFASAQPRRAGASAGRNRG